jgi:hypothetical protein
MSNQQQIHRTTGMGMGRRRFMQAVAGTAAAGSMLALDDGPVGQSQAIAPVAAGVLAGAGIAAGGVALGWALREFEVIGADDPAEGLTPEVLKQQIYEAATKRQSTTRSTIVDNQNIVDAGLPNTLYVEGKLAAIEALNAGKSESEVLADSKTAVDSYAVTIEKNLLKSWNEAIKEGNNLYSRASSHADVTADSVFTFVQGQTDGDPFPSTTGNYTSSGNQFEETAQRTLTDGSTMTVNQLMFNQDPTVVGDDTQSGAAWVTINLQDEVHYLYNKRWNDVWTSIQTAISDVKAGLDTWVTNVYGQVQSGDIAVSELITPRERAAMMTDDGKYPQAVADLLALNVPVDLEREATVSLDYMSEDVTLRGTLGITSPPDTLESGTQYNPETDNLGSVYLTYDVGTGEGVWSGYDDVKGVDGGTVEFEKEPLPDVTYRIETNYNETAEVVAGDFTEGTDGSSNTVWTVDVSDQLENSIADIETVTFYTPTDETRYETIQITGNFTIEKFMNQETGEEETSANFTSSEPQSDNNYVTQEEWDQLEQQNQELIEKYENATSGGGGGFLPDLGSLSPVEKAVGAIGIGGGGYALLNGGLGGGGSGGGGSN